MSKTSKYNHETRRLEDVTEYHLRTAIRKPINILRAIINKYNPDLALYGYTLYRADCKDMYVHYNDDYTLYIDVEAYLKKDFKKVNEGILNGFKNIIECSKKLKGTDPNIIFKEITSSALYVGVLNLKEE